MSKQKSEKELRANLSYTCPCCGQPHPRVRVDEDAGGIRGLLDGLGFVMTEYFDRDLSDFDNIRVVEYRKGIAQDCAVVYSEYHVAKAPGEFELTEQSAELAVGDCSVQLRCGVSDLLGLMAKLQGMIQHG